MASQLRALASKASSFADKAFSMAGKELSVLETLHDDAMATLERMAAADPGLKGVLSRAFGYAVFPSVGKASLVVGGAFGKGEVFRKNRLVGYAGVAQLTLGVQLGGQTFGQVIAFENEPVFERFKQGKLKFAANASAVLVKAGAAASARYERGVMNFLSPDGGASLELSIGGQKFFFYPAVLGRGKRAPKDFSGGSENGGGGDPKAKPRAKKPAARPARRATRAASGAKKTGRKSAGPVKPASRRRAAARGS